MPEQRILVVDDEPDLMGFVTDFLKSHGFIVTTAADGELALELLGQNPFDLVLTDLGMPKMGGDILLVLARERNIKIPFIAMSGHGGDKVLAAKLRQDGFAEVLGKPFQLADMLEAVTRLAS